MSLYTLQELKAAHDEGLLSDNEFENTKQSLTRNLGGGGASQSVALVKSWTNFSTASDFEIKFKIKLQGSVQDSEKWGHKCGSIVHFTNCNDDHSKYGGRIPRLFQCDNMLCVVAGHTQNWNCHQYTQSLSIGKEYAVCVSLQQNRYVISLDGNVVLHKTHG